MSNMPTLILPPRLNADGQAIQAAAHDAGWDIYAAPGWRLPRDLTFDNPVLYADVLFADIAAGSLGLALLDPPLDWLIHLPNAFVKRSVNFTTLAEAHTVALPKFIKPADDKCFPARVYETPEQLPAVDTLPEETPVLIAEPVVWEVEYRCFVRERAVAAASPYMRFGELAEGAAPEREEALAFAAVVLHEESLDLPPAVVLDVGYIADRGWAVVEANPAWGSGIYACDPAAVLPVLQRACASYTSMPESERRWIRPLRSVLD